MPSEVGVSVKLPLEQAFITVVELLKAYRETMSQANRDRWDSIGATLGEYVLEDIRVLRGKLEAK